MIRFLRFTADQELISPDPCFAFFNTRTMKFLEFNDEQIWDSEEDLVGAWNAEPGPKIAIGRLIDYLE